jgi:signal transduction histidine kinase
MTENNQKMIAVIDDESIITESIHNLLSLETQYDVVTYNCPLIAYEELKDSEPDLIISDFYMKDMNGIDLLKKLRRHHPDIPMIVLTAYADKENTIKAINEISLYYYLEKPWDNDELLLIVRNAVEKGDLISEIKKKIDELEKAYRQLEEAQQQIINKEKLSTIGSMASKIIHDLKNPMTSISGFAELIMSISEEKEENIKPEKVKKNYKEIKEFAQIIRNEVKRLVDMTSEILQFAKGDELYNKTPMPLKDILLNTVSGVRRILEKENIEIKVDVPKELLIMDLDQDKIIQMLYNLIYNARDAMPEGGTIIIKLDKKDKDKIMLSVTDNGKGMPENIKENIFKPFVTYGKPSGTGLGMAIVKKIVDAHKGEIEVESKLNEGTRFDIVFNAEHESRIPL